MRSPVLSFVLFFKFVLTRSSVGYLVFHLRFLLQEKNIFPAYSCFPRRFFCHYFFFHYVCFEDYKKPPLVFRHSSTQNQFNQHIKHDYGQIHRHSWRKTTTARGNHRWQKLRYIALQISIWDFFGIPQANLLALDKNEKSRMLSEYYSKLVLQYFGKKI